MNEYDKQIEFLTKNPHQIYSDWTQAKGIFKFMRRPDNVRPINTSWDSGCPTMIAHESAKGVFINGYLNEELTEKVKSDSRIPAKTVDIKIEHLAAFKEHQEALDKAYEALIKKP